MASPSGIYVGETAASLATIIAAAQARIVNGDRTSLTGAGKGSSRNFSMSAEQMLKEAQYALALLNGTRASKVVNRLA